MPIATRSNPHALRRPQIEFPLSAVFAWRVLKWMPIILVLVLGGPLRYI